MRTTLKISEIVDEWLDNSDVGLPTKHDYRKKISLWFRWLASKHIPPREPTHRHILEYKEWLNTQRKSQYTVNGYVTVVKLFYRYCSVQRYCENIGVGILSSSRFKEHKRSPLSREQAVRLLQSIDTSTLIGKRDKLIVALMLTNGLRTCEVERINIGDFTIEDYRDVLYIQRKGRKDKRESVAITPMVIRLKEDYLSARACYASQDAMFVNHSCKDNGSRLVRLTIGAIIKRRLRDIGIVRKDITAHSLRHTCGSLLVENGVPIEAIRDLLGHSSSSTTRIYVDMAIRRKMLENSPSKVVDDLLS